MLSIVLYGRNDNYGYNLHKRAALSLNCMAEVLTDADDEILFVDYNTPDDFPTFPEAIADTLTDKSKRHLRILRVRPSVHRRFASRTHLNALEPVARNVAVRRSNPANRWILSTNTDMIFVPRTGQSLSEIVSDLAKGHYGIPRFEVPETLWEALDRRDPQGVIDAIGRWGWDLHLNEIVAGMKPVLFDGPGDFQLMAREDLFAIGGFDENMFLGWHVDANIAKRMSLIYGDVCDLSKAVFGYHCDHTRQVTPAHTSNAAQNDSNRFFHDITRPDVPEQAESWGCPDEEIEEIRISSLEHNVYLNSVNMLARKPLSTPRHTPYIPETYNRCDYSPEHVLPFLLDIFASAPRHWQVAWLGVPGSTFSLFVKGWRNLGFAGPIMVHHTLAGQLPEMNSADVQPCSFGDMVDQAQVFIFDFSRGDGTLFKNTQVRDQIVIRSMIEAFRTLVAAEAERSGNGGEPRRFLGLNAIHNQFERLFSAHVNCAKTPFSVRIRHGFLFKTESPPVTNRSTKTAMERKVPISSSDVLPVPVIGEREELTENLLPGPAGVRIDQEVRTQNKLAGLVAKTRPLQLSPGRFRIEVRCHQIAPRQEAVSGFDLWLVYIIARLRGSIGYPLERRLRRIGSRLLGRHLSQRVKAYLSARGATAKPLDREQQFELPILQLDIHLGGVLLSRNRVLGGDIFSLAHTLVFDVPDSSQKREAIILSFMSNGAASFGISLVRLSRIAIASGAERLSQALG